MKKLVGKYVVMFDNDDCTEFAMGEILDVVGDRHFLVRVVPSKDGVPSYQCLMSIDSDFDHTVFMFDEKDEFDLFIEWVKADGEDKPASVLRLMEFHN